MLQELNDKLEEAKKSLQQAAANHNFAAATVLCLEQAIEMYLKHHPVQE